MVFSGCSVFRLRPKICQRRKLASGLFVRLACIVMLVSFLARPICVVRSQLDEWIVLSWLPTESHRQQNKWVQQTNGPLGDHFVSTVFWSHCSDLILIELLVCSPCKGTSQAVGRLRSTARHAFFCQKSLLGKDQLMQRVLQATLGMLLLFSSLDASGNRWRALWKHRCNNKDRACGMQASWLWHALAIYINRQDRGSEPVSISSPFEHKSWVGNHTNLQTSNPLIHSSW